MPRVNRNAPAPLPGFEELTKSFAALGALEEMDDSLDDDDSGVAVPRRVTKREKVAAAGAGWDEPDNEVMLATRPFILPSRHFVSCLSDEEYELCEITANPYLLSPADIPPEGWIGIKQYLEAVLLRERLNKVMSEPEFFQRASKDISEQVRVIDKLQARINEFQARLDPLRAAKGDDGLSVADWRANVQVNALAYARSHIGEYTWVAFCPEITCRFHKQPIPMLMEVPHFAMDPAAGPGVVWNQQVMELVHLHYCPGCSHEAHFARHSSSLTVIDAARILDISAVGLLAICYERKFPLGFDYSLDRPETLTAYVQEPRRTVVGRQRSSSGNPGMGRKLRPLPDPALVD